MKTGGLHNKHNEIISSVIIVNKITRNYNTIIVREIRFFNNHFTFFLFFFQNETYGTTKLVDWLTE